MNRFLSFVSAACMAILYIVGCEPIADGGKIPAVTITKGEVTATTITFTVTATDAAECAYLLYGEGELSPERILSDGVAIEGNGRPTTVTGLTPETTYLVVAAARNSEGAVMTSIISLKTAKSSGNDDKPELPPHDPDAKVLEIERTTQGRWYDNTNYYVTLVATTGERLTLDFYTISETMSSYLPYGNYIVNATMDAYTICSDSSFILLSPEDDVEDGHFFTDGIVNISVRDGLYTLAFQLTYEVDGLSYIVEGEYNGLLSGAAVPEGDNEGVEKLIEVHEVEATSFRFTIHAEEGQYWRCSVVDKRVYDQYQSNPGAWVVSYGFMLDGTRTFNWENGKVCEHVAGLEMSVTSSTDYLILAALMDYSEGQENNLLGGVEVVQIRTKAEAAGVGSVDIVIKEVNTNDVLFDCTFSDDVWCCYVAMMETANLDEIKAGKYALVGYESFEECMLSLIPDLSHDNMRQFLEPQVNYRWDYLKYSTSYTICVKVEDMDKRVSYVEFEPFTTK